MSDPNAEFDEKLRVMPKGSKKVLVDAGSEAPPVMVKAPPLPERWVPQEGPPLPLPQPPTITQTGAVALALELEQSREQIDDYKLQLAARELQIENLRVELNKAEDLMVMADRNYQAAINETVEIRGVLKSLAAILVKWDGWHQSGKQDPEVQS